MTAIPADAATWIRDVVLPPAYRKGTRDQSVCPCQWGVCGHCQAGRHEKCNVVAWGGAPRAHGDTRITDARGLVAGGWGVRSTEVWRSGRPCRWICPCGCTPIGCALPPASPAGPEQLDLFAALPVGAVRP
ncbi:DUF6248 family natural product biosynthesis protein [Micromonospora robiginosa]|uniref:DUF6248 family natural product biosynthesis protein n=1 Tax=Micromonospora robiginosa TaxID=2749844 RepID=A0A7L6B7Y2_9ACTN|nr:DUF6248 family natural product biosynthesis protein [Micromonospora ferruginea]QLQ37971.1 DUF6248 family natural product biosynthesis protein [Micromonospora ferruginea]